MFSGISYLPKLTSQSNAYCMLKERLTVVMSKLFIIRLHKESMIPHCIQQLMLFQACWTPLALLGIKIYLIIYMRSNLRYRLGLQSASVIVWMNVPALLSLHTA